MEQLPFNNYARIYFETHKVCHSNNQDPDSVWVVKRPAVISRPVLIVPGNFRATFGVCGNFLHALLATSSKLCFSEQLLCKI